MAAAPRPLAAAPSPSARAVGAAAVGIGIGTRAPRALAVPFNQQHRCCPPRFHPAAVVATFASRSGASGGGDAKRRRKDGGGAAGGASSSSAAAAPPPPPPPLPEQQQAASAPPPEVGWMWSGGGSGGRAAATKQSLKSAGLRAKKSLGQNFLTDEAILSRIVRASGVQRGDRVLEVGPGTGNLTRHLIGAGARVTAVEKDDALAARLAEAAPGLEALVHGDVLRVGLRPVVAQMLGAVGAGGGGEEEQKPGAAAKAGDNDATTTNNNQTTQKSVKIVANLPYNITKEFLLASLPLAGVSEVTLMLEEDAARRLADPKPGRPDYRAMSVLVHRWSKPKYLFRIPRDRYYPPPGVDGAMITFKLVPPQARPPLPLPAGDAAEKAHAALVNAAFSERRKMMRNVLTSGIGRGGRDWGAPTRDPAVVAAALQDAGARDEARPQELSSAQFAAFHCALARRAAEAMEAYKGGVGGGGGVDDDDDDAD